MKLPGSLDRHGHHISSAMVEHADGLPRPQRNWAILTIALGLVMAVMDGAIANVALPTIAKDLHAKPGVFDLDRQWLSVGDHDLAATVSFARRNHRLSPRLPGRAIAVHARIAILRACAHAAADYGGAHHAGLRRDWDHERQRGACPIYLSTRHAGRGIGINALVVALSAAVGPTVAAAILAVGTWPYLFAVNVPLGLVALTLGWRCLPHTTPASHGFDWQSAALSAVTFGLGIAAIDSLGHGEALSICLSEFCVAAVAGLLLVFRQTHTASPLLPVDLLRIPIFALSIATSIASFCAQMLAFVAMPFYLESRFGYSAVQIGLLITPWPIAVALTAPLAGRLVERYPAGLLGGIGLLLFALGLGSLALLPAYPSIPDVIWRMALAGAGFGLFQTPNNRTMIATAPRERSGGASGMLGTARLLGQTTGAALVSLFLARYPAEGTRISLLTGVGFALLGAALSMLRLSPAGARGAERVRIREDQRLRGE